ncbi:hypothetical protein BDV96DRAFT_607240 [Lophiotrema nucula]|uniref:Uncharacterized protein n=1 Tax=Lophiotrema nucula TaxID=690887 RepID=A0A6A5YJN3_9PLEO|nr:hypothetical protein BDV96DRAFT_607240 [Lophiotrema nucula]
MTQLGDALKEVVWGQPRTIPARLQKGQRAPFNERRVAAYKDGPNRNQYAIQVQDRYSTAVSPQVSNKHRRRCRVVKLVRIYRHVCQREQSNRQSQLSQLPVLVGRTVVGIISPTYTVFGSIHFTGPSELRLYWFSSVATPLIFILYWYLSVTSILVFTSRHFTGLLDARNWSLVVATLMVFVSCYFTGHHQSSIILGVVYKQQFGFS